MVAAGSWLYLLPDDAAAAPRPSAAVRAQAAAGAAVLPRLLTDQKLRPPTAFDELRQPRTTAVALLIRGEVGGRPGLYGTDVATGALVRLHDLPGTSGNPHWPDDVAVSPDGHLLSDGVLVVDLRAATVRAIAGAAPVKAGSPAAARGPVAVFDDGTVLAVSTSGRLWRYPPAAERRVPAAVPGIGDVTSIQPQTDGRVLVAGTNDLGPIVNLVNPSGDRPSIFPVLGLSPDQPAAEVNGTVIHPAVKGGLEVRDVPGTHRDILASRSQLGRIQALAFGPFRSGGRSTGVVLGTGDGGDMTLRQVPMDGAASSQPVSAQVTGLTRIPAGGELPLSSTTRFALAAEILTAPVILVDLPAEPWWAPLAGPGWPTGALILIAFGVLIVVLPLAFHLSRASARSSAASSSPSASVTPLLENQVETL